MIDEARNLDRSRASYAESRWLYEADARNAYRKWDNIKHISDEVKSRFAPRKVFDKQNWGITIRKKTRNSFPDQEDHEGLEFSVVVTLKEMFGKDHIDDFVYRCSFDCGWIVNRVNMDIINEIYAAAEVDIEFED